MCTHNRWVHNRYTGESLYVKCGVCPSCQQGKADRLYARICAHERKDKRFSIFVTLNYNNQSLPYVLLDEVKDSPSRFNVYRNIKFVTSRNKCGRGFHTDRIYGRNVIGQITPNQFDFNRNYLDDVSSVVLPQRWKYERTAVGVAFGKDFGDFIKRFKLNLTRYYGIPSGKDQVAFVRVQEYGPTTFRPHFHFKMDFPEYYSKYYEAIRRSIVQAWPYCSRRQIKENIGIAIAGQRYISSYTCRPSGYPDFLKVRSICQKTAFSRGYGFDDRLFDASFIKDCLKRHDFTYVYQYSKDGVPTTVVSPIPKYVCRAYFPYIKGLCRLDGREVFAVLSSLGGLEQYSYKMGCTFEDVRIYTFRILRAASRLGMSLYDYAYAYDQYRTIVMSQSERNLLCSVDNMSDWYEFYDNMSDVYNRILSCGELITDVIPPSFSGSLLQPDDPIFDPNKYLRNIKIDEKNELKYNDWLKRAKINDYTASLRLDYIVNELNSKHHVKYFKEAVL